MANNFFEDAVKKLFEGSDRKLVKEDTVYTYAAKQALRDRLADYYDKNKDRMDLRAKQIGVNLDKGEGKRQYAKGLGIDLDKNEGDFRKALDEMSPEMIQMMKDYEIYKDPSTPYEEKQKILMKYGGSAEFERFKDILDKLSLTPMYDKENAKDAGINFAPYGTNYTYTNQYGQEVSTPKKSGIKGGNVSYEYSGLSLTDVSDKDIIDYFKTGTRAERFEKQVIKAENGDENAKEGLRNVYFKATFNKIMNSKFGYDFRIPTSMYTFGNSKLPKDTLVVNFTTAHRCPAWEECLVGYACYARGSEHNYEGLHNKNSNLHLMWMSAHNDENLLNDMFRVIKMHLVNPKIMASALLNNPNTSEKWINFLNNYDGTFDMINGKSVKANYQDDSFAKMSKYGTKQNDEMEEGLIRNPILEKKSSNPKKPTWAADKLGKYIYDSKFNEIFDEKDIEAIKSVKNTLRAHFIRLNEEGDFIGQWLLDAFDELAGELKILGISTAAYTCRNLNYDKIQNIILNASTLKVGTLHDLDSNLTSSDASSAIARRFFAVPKEIYARLEDTYQENGKQIDYDSLEKGSSNKGEWDGTKPLVPLFNENGKLSVKYNPKRFTINDEFGNKVKAKFMDKTDPNGAREKDRMYYKCPCGRHGDVIKGNKPMKLDCYLCRMCYEPKNIETGELYVLVELHGDNIDSFNSTKANKARGIDSTISTFTEAADLMGNRINEQSLMNEKLGLKMVSKNVIDSAKEHIQKIADEENIVENKFKSMLNRINEVDNKLR